MITEKYVAHNRLLQMISYHNPQDDLKLRSFQNKVYDEREIFKDILHLRVKNIN